MGGAEIACIGSGHECAQNMLTNIVQQSGNICTFDNVRGTFNGPGCKVWHLSCFYTSPFMYVQWHFFRSSTLKVASHQPRQLIIFTIRQLRRIFCALPVRVWLQTRRPPKKISDEMFCLTAVQCSVFTLLHGCLHNFRVLVFHH